MSNLIRIIAYATRLNVIHVIQNNLYYYNFELVLLFRNENYHLHQKHKIKTFSSIRVWKVKIVISIQKTTTTDEANSVWNIQIVGVYKIRS